MESERRRVPRVKTKVPALYVSPRSELRATVTSISESGLFLYSTQLDPQGTPVRLEFSLPGSSRTIHATGEVIYIGFQDGLRGMGVKFNRLSNGDREAILRLVRDGDPTRS